MDAPFLVGLLTAWAIAQVAMGIFFVLAFTLGRRDDDYLLFGLLCLDLAVTTGAIAWGYSTHEIEAWKAPARTAHLGAIFGGALNLHFVIRFARLEGPRRALPLLYALAALLSVPLLSGNWWIPDSFSVHDVVVFGHAIPHVLAHPTVFASAAHVVTALELSASLSILLIAYRSGRKEALTSCIGGFLMLAAGVNDMLLAVGINDHSVYVLPHAFMIYAFGVGSTLLVRYRMTAGALEQVETDLQKKTEELRHSHAELQEVQVELVKKEQLASVGELAAAIAHEVRNPLAIIMNAVAGLRRSRVTEQDRATLLDIVDEETARLNRLVTDLLRFARPVNVKRSQSILEELAERTRAVVGENHELAITIVDGAPRQIWVDASLMRLVFDNLVENACQAMPDGGKVEIVLSPADDDGSRASIQVKDSGPGMSASVLERAGDPFFTTRPSGTGLGLPIVQRITEAHGGTLKMQSVVGHGTTVTVVLPIGSPEPSDPDIDPKVA